MVAEASIHIIVPLIVGFIIGILEAWFIMKDENSVPGKEFVADITHGVLFSVFGTLVACNVPWIIQQGWIPDFLTSFLYIDELGRSVVMSALISVVIFLKVSVSHAIKGAKIDGLKEKAFHKLIIALLVGFSPYYIFAFYPVLKPYLGKLPYL